MACRSNKISPKQGERNQDLQEISYKFHIVGITWVVLCCFVFLPLPFPSWQHSHSNQNSCYTILICTQSRRGSSVRHSLMRNFQRMIDCQNRQIRNNVVVVKIGFQTDKADGLKIMS